MDVVAKIYELNRKRGWSVYKLAKEAELSTSTLTNMINRGTSPSLVTIERLCHAYQLSLSEFFKEKENDNEVGGDYLEMWHRLSANEKVIIQMMMEYMINKGER